MALAFEWVGRVFAVSLTMFCPGVLGQWLDKRLGTNFLVLMGFGVGLTSGFTLLMIMVRDRSGSTAKPRHSDKDRSK